ncbi:putative heme oxygenase-like protein [Rosellinia necatrix]|uniref:Putative heme oxygenase-like protein n=1 Tax=Rosellinia necatrix TaxID=77044 RepID=A0A1W2TLD6_ROSNE|nr:putative heme oxygenase-like protein [Rosellinia necatrix]
MPPKTGATTRSLPDCINATTRSVHTKLNKLVTSRLRLALPPHADDASQYVSGLLHITPIYMVFESTWRTILEPQDSLNTPNCHEEGLDYAACNPDGPSLDNLPDTCRRPVASSRIQSLLASLYFQKLERSQALQNDLASLTFWSARTLKEKLNHAMESPILGEFLAHIRESVQTSPHKLLAYSWVLYMALFSGGRFIRDSLEEIYPAFWVPASAQKPIPATLAKATVTEGQPLNFFQFDTPEDGEDLKSEFKKRLLDEEDVLTKLERDEIIEEACYIFDYMIRLVSELDDICGTDKDAAKSRLLGLRSRDSLVVENERRQNLAEKSRKATTKADSNRDPKASGEGHVKFS